jgi:hypothetical protein
MSRCYGNILALYLADTGIGAGFILVTMIVGTDLYRPGRGFFLSLRQLHYHQLTMTIANGHLVDNYALE